MCVYSVHTDKYSTCVFDKHSFSEPFSKTLDPFNFFLFFFTLTAKLCHKKCYISGSIDLVTFCNNNVKSGHKKEV